MFTECLDSFEHDSVSARGRINSNNAVGNWQRNERYYVEIIEAINVLGK